MGKLSSDCLLVGILLSLLTLSCGSGSGAPPTDAPTDNPPQNMPDDPEEPQDILTSPSNLAASDLGNNSDTRVTWVDKSNGETEFRIQRQTQNSQGNWGSDFETSANADAQSFQDSPGAGTHRYRIAARSMTSNSAWTEWAVVTVTSGWAQFTPSADSRMVYVSSSQGNDANSGLSENSPKRTIASGFSLLRHGFPDWLLLKRGDVWDETLGHWIKGGRSATERMIVTTYGTSTQRPLLRTGIAYGFDRSGGGGSPDHIDNIAVMGIHFWANAHTGDADNSTGINFLGAGDDILFEDCLVENFSGGANIQGSSIASIHNLTFHRCFILDSHCFAAHSQGIFASKVQNLTIDECVIDHNGWKEGVSPATIFNHNMYIREAATNVVVRRSVIARASSHGVSLNQNGLIEDNLIVQNPIGIFMRTAPTTARGNVILESRDISQTEPRGFGIICGPVWPEEPFPDSGPALIEDNIIAHKNSVGANSAIQISSNAPTQLSTITVRNNTVYNWQAQNFLVNSIATQYDRVTVTDNVFCEPFSSQIMVSHGQSPFSSGRFTYARNRYQSLAPTSSWFFIGSQNRTFAQWVSDTGETGATNATITLPHPERTVATYMASIGGTASTEAFLAAARQQSRLSWNPQFTAAPVIAYLRDGMGQ